MFEPIVRQFDKEPTWIGMLADWKGDPEKIQEALIHVGPEHLATHTLVLGATGSGKTNLLHHLLAQDIRKGHTVVVLDLRGDLVSSVIEMCVGRVDCEDVDIIDPRSGNWSAAFDPLYGTGDPAMRALGVLNAIEQESDGWGVQLAETLRNALMLLAECRDSITKLGNVLYDRPYRLWAMEKCTDENVLAFWSRFDRLTPEQQQTMASPVMNKVSLLLAPKSMREMLDCLHVVDLSKSLNTPGRVILISLAVDEMHRAGRMLGRMALGSICREVFARVQTAEKDRVPVRLYVDEFSHFGETEFETIIAEGRRFRFSLVLAHQTLAQLTPRMKSMILNNVGAKFVFRSGRTDAQAMNTDIFGKSDEYPFTSLKTGTCLAWFKDHGAITVEVNEPILKNVGERSKQANEYISIASVCNVMKVPLSTPRMHLFDGVKPIDGEDWLCA